MLERVNGWQVMSAMAEIAAFLDEADELFTGAVLLDGFELALVGMGTRFNKPVAVYDYVKCIDTIIDRDHLTEEEAIEFFESNVVGASVGESTPIIVNRWAPWTKL